MLSNQYTALIFAYALVEGNVFAECSHDGFFWLVLRLVQFYLVRWALYEALTIVKEYLWLEII